VTLSPWLITRAACRASGVRKSSIPRAASYGRALELRHSRILTRPASTRPPSCCAMVCMAVADSQNWNALLEHRLPRLPGLLLIGRQVASRKDDALAPNRGRRHR